VHEVSVANSNFYRSDEISAEGTPLPSRVGAKIGEMARRSLMAYFTVGDLNWRHNISGQPFLARLISPLFGVGLIVVVILAMRYLFGPVRHASLWRFLLLSAWFLGMLAPVIVTAESVPHGLRSVGTIPSVFIISAWAIYAGLEWVQRALPAAARPGTAGVPTVRARPGFQLVALCVAAALIGETYFLYFVFARQSPEYSQAFRSDLTTTSRYLLEKGSKEDTYVVLDRASARTVDYLTTVDGAHPDHPRNRPYRVLGPVRELKPGDQIVLTQPSLEDVAPIRKANPSAVLDQTTRNPFGETIMIVLKIPR
jgi:hypothetical protein